MILLLLAFNFLLASADETCTIVKVRSKQSGEQFDGTGFAITENLLLTNNHSIAPTATSVSLVNLSTTGTVVKRDFHTDLAWVHVEKKMYACPISEDHVQVMDKVRIDGISSRNNSITSIETYFTNVKSSTLAIPGVRLGYETAQVPVTFGLSGSPVFLRNKVVGIVAQINSSNSGLIIPVRYANLESPVQSNYMVDVGGEISFDGLRLGRANDLLVGGDPHGGIRRDERDLGDAQANVMQVSGRSQSSDGVPATVYDVSILKTKQPKVANAIKNLNQIVIKSVDGVPTRSLLALLSVLGSCSLCQIDTFTVAVENPGQIEDRTLRVIAYVEKLSTAFRNSKKIVEYDEVRPSLDTFTEVLLRISSAMQISGTVDPSVNQVAKQGWEDIENIIVSWNMTDEEYDILEQIRGYVILNLR